MVSKNIENEKEKGLDQESAVEKAFISILENCTIDAGQFSNTVTYKKDQKIPAQFNPTDYRISISSKYEPEKSGITQDSDTFGLFRPPEPSRLTVTLLYDSVIQADYFNKVKNDTQEKSLNSTPLTLDGTASIGADVNNAYAKYDGNDDLNETYIESLLNLARLTTETARPPLICFSYGSTKFIGYMESVDVNFVRFNKAGEVIRAEISLTINEALNTAQSSGDLKGAGTKNDSFDNIESDEPLSYGNLFGDF